jgi:hypothetical protein
MKTLPDLRKFAESIGQFTPESERQCGFLACSSCRLSIRRPLVPAQVEEPNLKNPPLRDGGFSTFRQQLLLAIRGNHAATILQGHT